MTLNEFINKRMAELGLGHRDLIKNCISDATLQKIRKGAVAGLRQSTKQVLAQMLQCTIGDINAAIADTQVSLNGAGHDMDLLAKEHGETSVMDAVEKLDQLVRQEHPVFGEDPEENRYELTAADVNWKARQAEEAAKKVPVKEEEVAKAVMAETDAYDAAEPGAMPGKEVLDELFPEEETEVKMLRKNCRLIMQASRAARRSCREELKTLFLKAATQVVLGEDQLSDLYSDFGYAVVKWLAEEEAADAPKREAT